MIAPTLQPSTKSGDDPSVQQRPEHPDLHRPEIPPAAQHERRARRPPRSQLRDAHRNPSAGNEGFVSQEPPSRASRARIAGPHSSLRRKKRMAYQTDQLVSRAVSGMPVTKLTTR